MKIKCITAYILLLCIFITSLSGCKKNPDSTSQYSSAYVETIIYEEEEEKTPSVQSEVNNKPLESKVESATRPAYTEISAGVTDPKKAFANPLGVNNIGDPFILVDNGTYYMYATSSASRGFDVWKSTNCEGWTHCGLAYERTATSFGKTSFWAPEVYKYQGKYFLVYSAQYKNDKGNTAQSIGIAVADSPAGPFVDYTENGLLYAPDYTVFDASLFFDDNGRVYLFYARDHKFTEDNSSQIEGIELSSDLKKTVGSFARLTTMTLTWENYTNEAPCVFKRNGKYYLMYSGGYWGDSTYCVGYAVASSPLGSYRKKDMILYSNSATLSGTGHNNYFFSPDGSEMFTVYHSHTDPKKGGGNRQLCVDRMIFDSDGNLSINGPTISKQPLPSGTGGTTVISPDKYTIDIAVKIRDGSAKVLSDRFTYQSHLWCQTLDIVPADGKGIKVSFNSATAVSEMWLYAESSDKKQPDVYDVVINDKYVIKNFTVSDFSDANILSFANLPENVSTVELIPVSIGDKRYASLSEIYFIK